MSITSGNDGYQAERRQPSLAIAGVQFVKKGSQPQGDGLAEAAAVWSIGARELRLLSSQHRGEPRTIRMAGDSDPHRREGGEDSVLEVQSVDNCSFEQMKQRFSDACGVDYRELLKQLRNPASGRQSARITRLRQRFQDIVSIDFSGSPLREQVEHALNAMQTSKTKSAAPEIGKVSPAEYRNRVWVTRPRPGVDRVTSAWLIRKFIDPKAKFAFAPEDNKPARDVAFDIDESGFGHRGEDCTFETMIKVFHIRDKKALVMAEVVHDADLFDEKFGRKEGFGIDEVMKGWAREGLSDRELLKRGMQLAEGLYKSLR